MLMPLYYKYFFLRMRNARKKRYAYVFAITKTRIFKYIENFTTKKGNFSDKKILTFFHISALNIDCGYSLEPPRRGVCDEYPQCMFFLAK